MPDSTAEDAREPAPPARGSGSDITLNAQSAPDSAPAPGLAPSAARPGAARPGPRAAPAEATVIEASGVDLPAPASAAAPDAPPPAGAGERFGRYRLLTEIGRGGMGVVYHAWDDELNRPVALKLLRSGVDSSPADVERFLREARAAARLRHPGIVQVHDVGTCAGRHYFTMDFIEGESLETARKGFAPRRLLEVLRDVALAVHAAHEAGVVHRDVKPANILLDRAGHAYVSDFGLAREVREEGKGGLTATGTLLGTPHYMSPEQAGGESGAAGPRSDVWSLGVILYEHLVGRFPFEGDGFVQIVVAILQREPEAPSRAAAREGRGRKVHRDLETICLTCLEKDPARRYASAAQLAADLGRFLEGEPIEASAPSVLSQAGRYLRRNRRGVAGWALAAVALAAVGVLLEVKAGQRRYAERLLASAAVRLDEALAASPDRLAAADRRGRIEQARDLVEPLVEQEPGWVAARRERARARAAAGDAAGAAADLAAATAAEPGRRDAQYAYGCLLLGPGTPPAERAAGRRLLETLAAPAPGGIDACAELARARLALDERAPVPAVAAARRALALDGSRVEAYALLAAVYARWPHLFSQPRALAEIDAGLALRAGEAGLYLARGRVLLNLRRYTEARDCCRLARLCVPPADADELEGDVYIDRREGTAALAVAERMLARDPDRVSAWVIKGRALAGLERTGELATAADRLYRLGTPEALAGLVRVTWGFPEIGAAAGGAGSGGALAAAGAQAFTTLDQGLGLAQALLGTRQAARALETTAELLRRFPEDPEVRLERARALARAGRGAQALAEVDEAIRRAPECAAGYLVRANLWTMALAIPKALEDCDRVLALWPASDEALRSRGVFHLLLDRRPEAIQDMAQRALLNDYPQVEGQMQWNIGGEAEEGARRLRAFVAPMLPGLAADVATALVERGRERLAAQDAAGARRAFSYALVAAPRSVHALTGLARTYALLGDDGAALEFLERAERSGFRDAQALREMPELEVLVRSVRFRALLARLDAPQAESK